MESGGRNAAAERTHDGSEGARLRRQLPGCAVTARARNECTAHRATPISNETCMSAASNPSMKTRRSAPLPGHSKKRTHCGERPTKTEALLPDVRVFWEEPKRRALPNEAIPARKNWQSVPTPLPNETCTSAESRRFSPSRTKTRAPAPPPGHSEKRTHCGELPKETKALLPAFRVFWKNQTGAQS